MGRGAATAELSGEITARSAKTKPTSADIYSLERSKALCQQIKEALAEAGLPRTSTLNGGELTGLTSTLGSTGFSVRPAPRGGLEFNIVISGREAGLDYRHWAEYQGDPENGDLIELAEPTDAEKLFPQIKKVFEDLGLEVKEVRYSGAQLHWDDDVDYTVTTKALRRDKRAEREQLNQLARQAAYGIGFDGYPARPALDESSREKSRRAWAAKQALEAIPAKVLAEGLDDQGMGLLSRVFVGQSDLYGRRQGHPFLAEVRKARRELQTD